MNKSLVKSIDLLTLSFLLIVIFWLIVCPFPKHFQSFSDIGVTDPSAFWVSVKIKRIFGVIMYLFILNALCFSHQNCFVLFGYTTSRFLILSKNATHGKITGISSKSHKSQSFFWNLLYFDIFVLIIVTWHFTGSSKLTMLVELAFSEALGLH